MATRSILISYAGYPFTPGSLMPDNGLANLAGALIKAGHETLILDYGTIETIKRLYPERLSRMTKPFCDRVFGDPGRDYRPGLQDFLLLKYLDRELSRQRKKEVSRIAREIRGKIEEFSPDFIGFKLWTGDGFEDSVRIAKAVKKYFPDLPILAGGPHVDVFHRLIPERTDVFDFLVYGEGEKTVVEVAEHINNRATLRTIPNLIFSEKGEIKITEVERIEKLDGLPSPVYDPHVYPSMEGDQKVKIITMDESRGCFMGCYFCPHPSKSGARLRMKSPAKFVEELKLLKKNYGFSTFRYAGSATPTRLATRIAKRLAEEQLNIFYSMFGNIRISREKDFKFLKESGCLAIFFGLESGSQSILSRSFGKSFTAENAEKILKACKASGIFMTASIIFPAPFETEKTREETLELLRKVRPDSVIVTFPILIPGTTWASAPRRFGFALDKDGFSRKVMNYKIKWLFPPRFWKPLPYTLNGKKFSRFTKESSEFSRTLRNEGFLVGTPDDLVLMAYHSGFQGRESEFFNLILKTFFGGDWKKALELNRKINSSVIKNEPS